VDGLPKEKDPKIALYCRSGRMSAEAAETLVGRATAVLVGKTRGIGSRLVHLFFTASSHRWSILSRWTAHRHRVVRIEANFERGVFVA
jgi:hypothetical protein